MQKLIFVLLLIAIACCLVGCPFVMEESHTQDHTKVINVHSVEMHKFFDRYFWLYDWEDPYVN